MYANNEENVVVLNNGLEFQEASNSSVEMQLNESKKTLQDEINNLFHIKPDDFDLTFKLAIYPIVKAFETALNTTLLFEKEKGKYFFEFDVKEIVKASLLDRFNAWKIAKETGWLTLYDTNTHTYYTPNTGESQSISEMDDMLESHEEVTEFDESGNDIERQEVQDGCNK